MGLTYNLVMQNQIIRLHQVMKMIAEYRLTGVPVIDLDENYMGLITINSLLNFYASNFSFKEPGSIIVLEMSKPDYSLAHLAQIIESNKAVVLSTQISANHDSTNILVTLKINKQDNK